MSEITPELHLEIQTFLFCEAMLLEETRLRDWLALLTDDVRYVLPVRRTVQPRPPARNEPEDVFSLFNDDKASLRMRVQRLETGIAHAEVPASVTQRLITNVVVEPDGGPDRYVVHSRFLVHQVRGSRLNYTFYGKRRDRLRREGGVLKIAERRIELAQTILPTTISIFL